MQVDREPTGPKDIKQGTAKRIQRILKNGFVPDGHINRWGCFNVGRGEIYCPQVTLWSVKTLQHAGSKSHIARTTHEGTIQILAVNETDSDETLIETVKPEDIRPVSLYGSGSYKVGGNNDNFFTEVGESLAHSPRVLLADYKLVGQEVFRLNFFNPCTGKIADAVVIGPDNQLLKRSFMRTRDGQFQVFQK